MGTLLSELGCKMRLETWNVREKEIRRRGRQGNMVR